MTELASIALGWLDLSATAALAGGLVSAAVVAEASQRGRRVLAIAAALLAVVLAGELAANAWRMQRISGITGIDLVRDVLEMRWTTLWLGRVVGLAVLAGFLVPRQASRIAPAVLAAVWLLPRSLQGHAGAHESAAAIADWVHLLAASSWIGSLLQFALSENAAPRALRRLRALATSAVSTLVASGVYGALFHLHSAHALFHSAYGRMLLVKVGIALPLFVLGASNHFRLSPRVIAGTPEASAELARAVKLELVLGAAVLAASALLGTLPMPHS